MPTVLYERHGRTAYVTLNRPDKLNAINDTLWRELLAALTTARDDAEVRAVVLRGAGRCFSVGQDLSGEDTAESVPPDPRTRAFLADLWRGEQLRRERLEWLFRYPKDTIAQVHGYCLGLAGDLAMMCQTLVCADDARFGDPSVRAGYAPMQPLWLWKVGYRKACELLLTGKVISGREAERLGLATIAVPAGELEAKVADTAGLIAKQQGIAGRDGHAVGYGPMPLGGTARRAMVWDAAGLATSWDFAAYVRFLSSVQRRGFA
ncbi:MAG: enoyl-CoA hydratase/isomerase family protein, partial [Chloroflexi bacterium]|nr:enoyl-CoA hydratase/isomerase family protein [Chloroflexota bacterium]